MYHYFMSPQFKALLLDAPDSQLDKSLKPLIQKWSEPPSALSILEVLDKAVHGGLASKFAMEVCEILLKDALMRENITLDNLVKQASWRKS